MSAAAQLEVHRFYVDYYRVSAQRAHAEGWPEGRRQAIERALWHRQEVRLLKKLAASRVEA